MANEIDQSVLSTKMMGFLFSFLSFLFNRGAWECQGRVWEGQTRTWKYNEWTQWDVRNEEKTALESSVAILLALYKSRYLDRLNDSVIFY